MATENKGVMVYLPKEVEEYITEFCTEYKITRKDKEGNILPSLGTGIVTYLKSQMSGESPGEYIAKAGKSLGNGLTKDEVLDLIREYSTSETPSNGLTREEVLDLIQQSITPIDSPQSIGVIEKLVIAKVEPLAASFEELETYTQNQFKALREELRAITDGSVTTEAVANVPTSPRKDKPNADGDTRTWCGFFEMVGMTAMTATEAQKKENADVRAKQTKAGLQAAKDQGLGEWAVKRAGRDFVRVEIA